MMLDDVTVIIPVHFEEGFVMFGDILYQHKRDMLKTVGDFKETTRLTYEQTGAKVKVGHSLHSRSL